MAFMYIKVHRGCLSYANKYIISFESTCKYTFKESVSTRDSGNVMSICFGGNICQGIKTALYHCSNKSNGAYYVCMQSFIQVNQLRRRDAGSYTSGNVASGMIYEG